ncbi:TPA: sugar phosphate isomerase/epimerase [Candidatus Poribacteria bacterium]|nr:sugar phosphate isomerase/epimerase [Candidatus Poribacteria bacterium]
MFKLAVISDEISQDFQTVVNVASEYKLDGVEIRSVWDKPPQGLADDDMKKMKDILDKAGIVVAGIASPFYKCNIDDDQERLNHIEILKKCIKMAHFFGVKIVRGFTFWNTGQTEAYWGKILEYYREPVKIAESEGIIIGVENEASTSVSTAKLLEKFINDVGSTNVRAIWDPANEVYADGGEKPFPNAYNRVKPYMIHCHAKDAAENEEGKMESVPVGTGVIDWKGQIKELLDYNYKGYLSLETHWRPKKALSEDLLNRPGGSAFSEAGEEASRICLDNIFQILKDLGEME